MSSRCGFGIVLIWVGLCLLIAGSWHAYHCQQGENSDHFIWELLYSSDLPPEYFDAKIAYLGERIMLSSDTEMARRAAAEKRQLEQLRAELAATWEQHRVQVVWIEGTIAILGLIGGPCLCYCGWHMLWHERRENIALQQRESAVRSVALQNAAARMNEES